MALQIAKAGRLLMDRARAQLAFRDERWVTAVTLNTVSELAVVQRKPCDDGVLTLEVCSALLWAILDALTKPEFGTVHRTPPRTPSVLDTSGWQITRIPGRYPDFVIEPPTGPD